MPARRTRQISIKDCYEILHLQKGATLQDVKSAYRRRAFELHPDLNPGNAEASRQFQLLNEAYVALSAILKPGEENRQKAKKEQSQAGKAEKEAESKGESKAENKGEKDSARASAAYAEQDVLRDLLNDPFARRVFEDIYSELNRKQSASREEPRAAPPPPPPPPPRDKPEKKSASFREPRKIQPLPAHDKTHDKGVAGAVKGWLRRQIDEEQSLTLPAARLGPGAKIRLQIRKGISEDLTAVDVTLPPDFAVGKPMRLRGLGKKVGPWQGDLYLTIFTE